MKNLLFLSALALGGCASSPVMMEHPTKTDIQPDAYECQNEAIHLSNSMGMAGNPFFIREQTERCLNHRGWTRVR